MNLRHLSNEDLHKQTQMRVSDERQMTSAVLHHLRENERRLLFAELGYSSLHEYCVKVLKYSESATYRRISAMRILKDLPEIEEKLNAGELSLSTVSQVQTHLRHSQKAGEKVDLKEKRELLHAIENLSSRQVGLGREKSSNGN